eukprot:403356990
MSNNLETNQQIEGAKFQFGSAFCFSYNNSRSGINQYNQSETQTISDQTTPGVLAALNQLLGEEVIKEESEIQRNVDERFENGKDANRKLKKNDQDGLASSQQNQTQRFQSIGKDQELLGGMGATGLFGNQTDQILPQKCSNINAPQVRSESMHPKNQMLSKDLQQFYLDRLESHISKPDFIAQQQSEMREGQLKVFQQNLCKFVEFISEQKSSKPEISRRIKQAEDILKTLRRILSNQEQSENDNVNQVFQSHEVDGCKAALLKYFPQLEPPHESLDASTKTNAKFFKVVNEKANQLFSRNNELQIENPILGNHIENFLEEYQLQVVDSSTEGQNKQKRSTKESAQMSNPQKASKISSVDDLESRPSKKRQRQDSRGREDREERENMLPLQHQSNEKVSNNEALTKQDIQCLLDKFNSFETTIETSVKKAVKKYMKKEKDKLEQKIIKSIMCDLAKQLNEQKIQQASITSANQAHLDSNSLQNVGSRVEGIKSHSAERKADAEAKQSKRLKKKKDKKKQEIEEEEIVNFNNPPIDQQESDRKKNKKVRSAEKAQAANQKAGETKANSNDEQVPLNN